MSTFLVDISVLKYIPSSFIIVNFSIYPLLDLFENFNLFIIE